MPRTKIVCTIGPSSRSPEMLEAMIKHGLNMVRLNFSHGTHAEHREVIHRIRQISSQLLTPVAILQDLSGPKIRTGKFAAGSVTLAAGDSFTLTSRDVPGDEREVSMTYANLVRDVEKGDTILLSDGALRLEVKEVTETDIRCEVADGGVLGSSKGINVPGRRLSVPSLTAKDREDLLFGLKEEVDYIALSFVRTAADVRETQRIIAQFGSDAPVIAKIEKQESVENIDEILAVADGIMVARGDLGVETPLESLPLIQKMLIDSANHAGKPVITGTQMMLSMVNAPRPTRAEVTDVANAVLDGTDAIMLTDETATGKHPLEALETMIRVARDVDKGFPFELWRGRFEREERRELGQAVSHAACHLADNVEAKCIVTFTHLGTTAKAIAKYRPRQRIIAVTPLARTYRRLALVWGVIPVLIDHLDNTDKMIDKASELVRWSGLAQSGDKVVITAGVPIGMPGTTNTVTVFRVR
jgi:pyruvate kinase